VKSFDGDGKGKRAQFGEGFPDPWYLFATHQCHDLNECVEVRDKNGDIDPDNMPGGPFKDPKFMNVPYGHKCKGPPKKEWGNLGKCNDWKTCFEKCLEISNTAAPLGAALADDICNIVHYEVGSGRCTAFTTKECQDSKGRWATEETDGMVVMKAHSFLGDPDPIKAQAAKAFVGNSTNYTNAE